MVMSEIAVYKLTTEAPKSTTNYVVELSDVEYVGKTD